MSKGLVHILFREFSCHPKKCKNGLKKQPNKSPKTKVQAGVLYMNNSPKKNSNSYKTQLH